MAFTFTQNRFRFYSAGSATQPPVPLVGGKVYFYAAGTTTPKDTYTDEGGLTANTNPVILDGRGEADIWLGLGSYKVVVTNAAGAQQGAAVDNIQSAEQLVSEAVTLLRGEIADLAADLSTTAAAAAANLLDFTQSGGSGVPITIDDKLKQIVSRAEFGSDAAFNAAKGTRPSIDGSANLDAKVTPAAEPTQGNLSDMLRPVAAGPRDAIVYNNATSVRVFRNHAVMGGFRYRGQYTKGRAPCFPMPTSKVASVSTGLGAEAAVRTENWYAVFACANAGDATATIKVMPYLRAGTVAGSNVPLIKAGEGIHALTAQTYAWTATNNLAGTDCLVISEGGAFSGRVTTITANVAGQVTLGTIGSVAAYDFLLPAPPGFTHYVYLGSFYFDTGEVRNIYDTGTVVKAKMIYVQEPSAALAGAVVGPPGAEFNSAGYICPLATAVVLDSSCVLSTASTGSFGESFDPDGGGHVVQEGLRTKAVTTNESIVIDNVQVPFLYHQKFWYYNAGTLNATRISGQFNVKGWFEP